MTDGWAAVFPGQGAQELTMGVDLARSRASAAARFRMASDLLGCDLLRLCEEGPLEELTRSDRAQPAIFVVSMVCFEAFQEEAPEVSWTVMGGLSSGEWAALCAAGVVTFEDAVRILEARGRFMQEACERQPGGMVSVIGLDVDTLEAIARATGVELANFNSPEQTVLSGPRSAVAMAAEQARQKGARRVIPLQVAGGFHSSLMTPAAERLAEVLQSVRLSPPKVPVVSNVTGEPHGGIEGIRRQMAAQVNSPVRWVDCVRTMAKLGARRFMEFGPGRVVSGLIRRIDNQLEIHNISDLPSLQAALAAVRGER